MKRISADALAALEEHSWPGNVRELENLIQRLIITTRHEEIGPADLPFARCSSTAWLPAKPFSFPTEAQTSTIRSANSRSRCSRPRFVEDREAKPPQPACSTSMSRR